MTIAIVTALAAVLLGRRVSTTADTRRCKASMGRTRSLGSGAEAGGIE